VRNRKASSTVLVDIARAQGKTTAQILIRYGLQKGWTPLPKSDDERRIEENRDVFGWELSGEEMDRLDALDEGEQGAIVEAVKNG
jgi:diketogulonate reductase-like aldo/keto reductase